jgi:hypothetical protein
VTPQPSQDHRRPLLGLGQRYGLGELVRVASSRPHLAGGAQAPKFAKMRRFNHLPPTLPVLSRDGPAQLARDQDHRERQAQLGRPVRRGQR